MSLHEVTLIDGGPKTSYGLRKTLGASTDPRFVVLEGKQAAPPVTGAQSTRIVSLLTFDEVPCGTDIVPIVHRAIRRGPAILAIPSGSPRDIAHILKTGASDVLLAPFRRADTLGRLLHWIGQCSPIDVNAALEVKADLGMHRAASELDINVPNRGHLMPAVLGADSQMHNIVTQERFFNFSTIKTEFEHIVRNQLRDGGCRFACIANIPKYKPNPAHGIGSMPAPSSFFLVMVFIYGNGSDVKTKTLSQPPMVGDYSAEGRLWWKPKLIGPIN